MTEEQIKQMEQDTALAVQLNREGSWEQALREAEAATVARNVARWQLEQAARAAKHQKDLAEASRRGMNLRQLKDLRRQEYQLRNCRATLAEIVQAHQPKGKR